MRKCKKINISVALCAFLQAVKWCNQNWSRLRLNGGNSFEINHRQTLYIAVFIQIWHIFLWCDSKYTPHVDATQGSDKRATQLDLSLSLPASPLTATSPRHGGLAADPLSADQSYPVLLLLVYKLLGIRVSRVGILLCPPVSIQKVHRNPL